MKTNRSVVVSEEQPPTCTNYGIQNGLTDLGCDKVAEHEEPFAQVFIRQLAQITCDRFFLSGDLRVELDVRSPLLSLIELFLSNQLIQGYTGILHTSLGNCSRIDKSCKIRIRL